MKKRLFKNEKLNKYAPHFLLVSIITLSIYPLGCYAWGPPGSRPPVSATLPPFDEEQVSVNSQEALRAFKCVSDKNNAEQKDRQIAFDESLRMEEAIRNNIQTVQILKSMYDTFKNKYPDCSFP